MSDLRTYIKSQALVVRGKGRVSKPKGVSFSPATSKLLQLLTIKLGNRYMSETIEEALITLGIEQGIKPEDLA